MQKRRVALAGALGVVCVAIAGIGTLRGASPVVNSTVAVVDPYAPARQMLVNSDGSINVSGTVGSSGTVAATQSGTWTVQPGNTPNTSPWLVTPVPGSSGSCTPYHLAGGTAASTNSTNIKASAGTLCHLTAINTTVTTYYLRMYNLAAAPTCSSATGAVHTYPVLPSGGINIPLPFGETYSAGIGFCVTATGADTANDNAAVGVYIEASYR